MRLLTKMKLINWHFFANETIDFDGPTLVTGDNGAGKSTLVDALQVVLIANLKKVRFNSSAHEEKTTRDLRSYLRGKTGTEGGHTFLRSEDFTSFIVLEITHTNTHQPYLIGVVLDYFSNTGDEEHVFFKIDEQKLVDDLFFQEGLVPCNRQQFFELLKARGLKYKQYRNDLNGYIRDLQQLFGGVKESYFSLLQKGISFTPITDLRRFVYDYILEERQIDVETMRDYFEKFRQVEEMVFQTEKEITALEAIAQLYQEFAKINGQIVVGSYMIARSRLTAKEQECTSARDRQGSAQQRLSEVSTDLTKARSTREEVEGHIDALEQSMRENQVALRERELVQQINHGEQTLSELGALRRNLVNRVAVEAKEWEYLWAALKAVEGPLSLQHASIEAKEAWQEGRTHEGVPSNCYHDIWRDAMLWLTLQRQDWNQRQEELCQQRSELQAAIAELERNQVLRADSPTMVLKRILEERLFAGQGDKEGVVILCEELEIRDSAWRNAIEGYLFFRKFDILVPAGAFAEAFALYERYKGSYGIEGVGLVDTGKLAVAPVQMEANSLAAEVITERDDVRSLIDFVLGPVIKCESAAELCQHRRAITASCMVYEGFVARQIPQVRYEMPYIGRAAVQVQLARKRQELMGIENDIAEVSAKIKASASVVTLSGDKQDRYIQMQAEAERVVSITDLESQLAALRQELLHLDRSELQRLETQRDQARQRRVALTNTIEDLASEKTLREDELRRLAVEIEQLEGQRNQLEEEFGDVLLRLSANAAARCEKKWERESKRKSPAQLLANYTSNNTGLQTRRQSVMGDLIKVRTAFTHEFHFAGDPQTEDNREFAERLTMLQESHLQEYKDKAKEAREQAERAFQEHFIAKLGEFIGQAKQDIKELNQALKDMHFGSDSYHFRLSAKPEMQHFYQMIMDPALFSGLSLFTESFLEKHGETIQLLFREITLQDEGFQEKMSRLTDYRSYLDFEIVITDDRKNKSFFSKVARDKSGGETQVPFYVAILASFYQAYQLYRKSDTFRLVIFDEAFNRMDAERIEEAVRFISTLGFQPLIVAPTGKIQLIVPHVNTNLIVMKDGFYSFVERVSRKEIEQWS